MSESKRQSVPEALRVRSLLWKIRGGTGVHDDEIEKAIEYVDLLAEKHDSLEEQLEALSEFIRDANTRTRQPIDLNYIAMPKDAWEKIVRKASSPASEPEAS